ncbi:MAG: DUF309 domain-containing protein [Planctomycetes bacterium]|nr:DUF309 domain-containing protein [Planctomycetota bacterium]
MIAEGEYDPRYLAGIILFNQRDFFHAHDVWEDLWNDCPSDQRRFHQGLIQAAVALYHWGNGNWRGTRRLFRSGRTYMSAYPDGYRGLDVGRFWRGMESAVTDLLWQEPPPEGAKLDPERVPLIELDPAPQSWPDPRSFLPED